MKLSIKSPVMASDVPEALKLIMADKRDELLDLIVARCTIDENGAPVSAANLTLKDKLALVTMAGAEFTGMDEGNG
jgi:hypothetical protein